MSTVRNGATIAPAARGNTRLLAAIDTPQELRPAPGMFVMLDGLGCRSFGRFTGRTRKFWGMACPTIERYEVDTVAIEADGSFALWGVPGARIPGIWVTRPENMVDTVDNSVETVAARRAMFTGFGWTS